MSYFETHFVNYYGSMMTSNNLFTSLLIWLSAAATYVDANGASHFMHMTGEPSTIFQSNQLGVGIGGPLICGESSKDCSSSTSVMFDPSRNAGIFVADVPVALQAKAGGISQFTYDLASMSVGLGLTYGFFPVSQIENASSYDYGSFEYTPPGGSPTIFETFRISPVNRYQGPDKFFCIFEAYSNSTGYLGNHTMQGAPLICFVIYEVPLSTKFFLGVPLMYSSILPTLVGQNCACGSSSNLPILCSDLSTIFGLILFELDNFEALVPLFKGFIPKYLSAVKSTGKPFIQVLGEDAFPTFLNVSSVCSHVDGVSNSPACQVSQNYSFCEGRCSVISIYNIDGNSIQTTVPSTNVTVERSFMSLFNYEVVDQVCNNTMSLSSTAWASVNTIPPVNLTQAFYQCSYDSFNIFIKALGNAGGATASIPFAFNFVISMMILIAYAIGVGREVTIRHKQEDKQHALDQLATTILELQRNPRLKEKMTKRDVDPDLAIEILILLLAVAPKNNEFNRSGDASFRSVASGAHGDVDGGGSSGIVMDTDPESTEEGWHARRHEMTPITPRSQTESRHAPHDDTWRPADHNNHQAQTHTAAIRRASHTSGHSSSHSIGLSPDDMKEHDSSVGSATHPAAPHDSNMSGSANIHMAMGFLVNAPHIVGSVADSGTYNHDNSHVSSHGNSQSHGNANVHHR